MFEHSVKVPRHYKVAANIFKEVSTKGGSVKTLLYDEKLRHFRTNVLYALITETIKHASVIDKIFENCDIIKNEHRLDPWLAKILTAELLFGKKTLPGKSKPEQTILSYKEKFEKFNTTIQDSLKTEVVRRPRYVRVNTNLLTTSDAIGTFQEEGYRFIRCTSGSYNDYLQQIQNLSEYDFTQDYHVKTVFVFSSGTKLHEHDLYLENKIILQDKATTLAVHLLAPEAGSVVLDMCAAPGMKTTQLAAFMRNQGKIIAVERNEKRYQILCDFVEKTGSKCVETVHKDALEIKRGEYSDVEYILLDPSCSGSGMELSVHNYIDANRLAKLTSLQEKFLKHAMNSFPKAKRIVYSTCSLFPEENERVVTNVVKTSRAKWRVQDVKELLKGQWNNFGSGMYGSMGTRCIYAKPDSDFTIGFFLAVLDRDPKDLHKSLIENSNTEQLDLHSEIKNVINEQMETDRMKVVKNKKKKNKEKEHHQKMLADKFLSEIEQQNKDKSEENEENEINFKENDINEEIEIDVTREVKKKKKKKKEKEHQVLQSEFKESINNIEQQQYKKIKLKGNDEISTNSMTKEEINEGIGMKQIITNKKKRKKEKKHHQEANESSNSDEQNVKDEFKRKLEKSGRKRKNHDKTDQDINVSPGTELESENIKRKKKKGEVMSEISDSELHVDDKYLKRKQSDSQKKNANKNKDGISYEEVTPILVDKVSCDSKKRKKKRKENCAETHIE